MFVFTVGEIVVMPVAVAQVADLAPSHMRGRYMGALGLTWASALIVAPGLGMQLLATLPAALWIGGCGLGILAAALVHPRADPDRAELLPVVAAPSASTPGASGLDPATRTH
jgi:MFS family permease